MMLAMDHRDKQRRPHPLTWSAGWSRPASAAFGEPMVAIEWSDGSR